MKPSRSNDSPAPHIVVIGAGVGGLAAAVALHARGLRVSLFERQPDCGGKARTIRVEDRLIDAGPTVLTMRPVFEEIFARAGARLADRVELTPLDVLARHVWHDGRELDLHADPGRSLAAIQAAFGDEAARGFAAVLTHARHCLTTLEPAFITAPRPGPLTLLRRAGPRALLRCAPFSTLWAHVGRDLREPHLRQLIGRYATYCGSSPFAAPALLALVMAAEARGVWRVTGGIAALVRGLVDLARAHGVAIETGAAVTRIDTSDGRACGVVLADGRRVAADAVVCNADVAALGAGLFGTGARRAASPVPPLRRSLSGQVWACVAEAGQARLHHHTVLFSGSYRAEFQALAKGYAPKDPTIYICAQDRTDDRAPGASERLLCVMNARADGDVPGSGDAGDQGGSGEAALRARLASFGVRLRTVQPTGPRGFDALFPGTGGALYGRATHGAFASFRRPSARSRLRGLYLAGGSVHPGPGLPMAARSGLLAADAIIEDLERS